MLEIEAKFAVSDLLELRHRLLVWGASSQGTRRDADSYFNAPDRDFARTDEAFRVRSIGERNFITYKGPKRDTVLKTRPEIELAFAEGAAAATDMQRLIGCLGYRAVATVHKTREVFTARRDEFDLQITLDTVDGVGPFAEVEIVAPESEEPRARQTLLAVAAELGLTQTERRSYLEMLLTRQGANP